MITLREYYDMQDGSVRTVKVMAFPDSPESQELWPAFRNRERTWVQLGGGEDLEVYVVSYERIQAGNPDTINYTMLDYTMVRA